METTRADAARPQTDDDLAVARQVLRTEAAALEALAKALDNTLSRALDILTRDGGGRVIVTGMGKSGHIGRKIAATLASTGTPAQYVHPGEASHGDLGMITGHDAILALSNSGETVELSDVIRSQPALRHSDGGDHGARRQRAGSGCPSDNSFAQRG